MYALIAELFNVFAKHGYPTQLNTLLLLPLWKHKGSKGDPGMYRGISLIHPLGRWFAKCVELRFDADSNARFATAQGGFRKHHRCEDQCMLLQLLYECAQADRRRVVSVFVDLAKAYDRVDRVKLFTSFAQKLGLDMGTIRLLQ